MREGTEREPLLLGDGPVGVVLWGYLVDGLRLGVVGVEEANELRGTHFSGMRVHQGRPLGGRGREPRRRRRGGEVARNGAPRR